jgi:hypothetical protein
LPHPTTKNHNPTTNFTHSTTTPTTTNPGAPHLAFEMWDTRPQGDRTSSQPTTIRHRHKYLVAEGHPFTGANKTASAKRKPKRPVYCPEDHQNPKNLSTPKTRRNPSNPNPINEK